MSEVCLDLFDFILVYLKNSEKTEKMWWISDICYIKWS